jgi:hypothetical protein
MKNMNRKNRILLCIGLILTTSNTLMRDYITLPDFARGALSGLGLGLMIWALVNQRRVNQRSSGSSCYSKVSSSDKEL